MRGRMEYVNRKIKIIRSRSAERLRGYIRPEVLQVGGGEDKRSQQVSDRHHLLYCLINYVFKVVEFYFRNKLS